MRITNVLLQINYHRHFQRIWKRQGKLQALELKVPEELQQMAVTIEDATKILDETNLFPPKEIEPSYKYIYPPSIYDKQTYFYMMDKRTKVSESENQILALTKTIPYSGLPSQLTSLIGKDSIPNQDELVKRSILQAQVWDGDQHKLPKKLDIKRPGYKFCRIYGTRHKKKVSGLLEKLSFLCDAATGKYAACLKQDKLLGAFCDFSVYRNNDYITFQLPCEILMTASEPLKRIASPDAVSETTNLKVPDIYPLKPTLDLTKSTSKHISPSIPAFDNRHIHTLLLAQKSFGFWFPKQMLATAIATCFSFAGKEAQMKYGANVKALPEPITVQCAYMDLQSFHFLVYQLNTLDLESDEGVKNQAWVDAPSPLYDTVSEKDLITGYNPDAFPELLALHLNGLHPSSL